MKKRSFTLAAGVLACLLWLGPLGARGAPSPKDPDDTPTPHAKADIGIDSSSFDKSTDPGQDFYEYANGGWLKQNPTPPSTSQWGRFNILNQQNQTVVFKLLMKCARDHAPAGTIEQKLGDFFLTGINQDRLDKQGTQPLKRDLEAIRAIQDSKSLVAVVVSMHKRGMHPFFHFHAAQDAKNSQMVIGELSQSGLGLPERDYYFRTDERSAKQRAAYQEYLVATFKLLGSKDEEAHAKAEQVYNLENQIAQVTVARADGRDPNSHYHPTTVGELSAGVAAWSWPNYFEAMGWKTTPETRLNVTNPKFVENFYKILESNEPANLRAYLEWYLFNHNDAYLSEDIAKFSFEFDKVLTGAPSQNGRNGRVLGTVNHLMGEALGRKFVEKSFSPKAKSQALEMVKLIQEALREDMANLPWMSPATRKEALAKLDSFHAKIGYPDKWHDFAGLKINRENTYVENVWSATAYRVAEDIKAIGKPVDHEEWDVSPHTLNAFYDPRNNEIVFPAAIIQPPFFSVEADDALNFGGLGSVIGHEITHGFDDSGRQYDGQGNLRDWWAQPDVENFNKLAQMVDDQFSSYSVLGGSTHINGKLVLGESIADMGGLRLSYLAYQKFLKIKPSKVIDGFTPEQRFFLGYARIWATNTRADYERLQINTDTHPPNRFRVNGPLSNMPEFAKAFHLPDNCPMVRKQQPAFW